MRLRYGNRARVGAAGALCCDNRGFAGGDTHCIMNNPPPAAAHDAHTNTQLRVCTYIQTYMHRCGHINYMFFSNPIFPVLYYFHTS